MPAAGPQKKIPHLHFVSTSAKYQQPNYVDLQLDSMNFYSYEIRIYRVYIQTFHCSLPLAPSSKQTYVSNWKKNTSNTLHSRQLGYVLGIVDRC